MGIFDSLGPVLDIGKTIASNLFAKEQQEDSQQFATAQSAFNASEAKENREWQKWMTDHKYQMEVGSLKAAGLNPMLAYMHGPGGTPGGATASAAGGAGIATPVTSERTSAGMQSASQIAVNDAVIEKTRAEADRARAEAEEIRGARIPERHQNIEKMKQEIGESAVRIERIWQETATGRASETNIRQQTENLKAELPRIAATIQNLKAQTVESLAKAGLSNEQAKEVHQRIQANLPGLERTLGDLEAQSRRMAQPAQEASAAGADSFIGQVGGYLRQLTSSLNGLLVAIPTGRGKK